MTRIATDILAPALAQAGLAGAGGPLPLDHHAAGPVLSGPCDPRRTDAQSGVHLLLISACDHAADAAEQWGSARATDIVLSASRVVGEVAAAVSDHVPPSYRDRATADVYRQAAAILDDALKIGNQSDLTERRDGGAAAGGRQAGRCKTRAGGGVARAAGLRGLSTNRIQARRTWFAGPCS